MSRIYCITYSSFILVLAGFYLSVTLIFVLWTPADNPDQPTVENTWLSDNLKDFQSSVEKSKRIPKNSNYNFMAPLKIIDNLEFQGETLGTISEATYDHWVRGNSPASLVKLLLYSAYLDERDSKYCIKVIGITVTKNSPLIKCKLNFESAKISRSITVAKKVINEHWNLNYSAYFLSCCPNSKETFNEKPISVKVFEDKQESFGKTIKIRDNSKDKLLDRGRIALCVKPFHYSYNRATWLIEFVEFYKMMGVEKFLFYNQSMGPEVESLVNHYTKQGLLIVLPWNLDLISQKEIRTQGIFAALNDCVYRFMHLYKHVVVVDVDEFIVPKDHRNYTELINAVESTRTTCSSGYVFKNAFFYLYWENDTSLFGDLPEVSPRNLPYLLTQYKTKRSTEVYPHGKRSKFIVNPEFSLEIGNHMIWRNTPKCKPVLVSEDYASVHHFRICEFGGYKCLNKPARIDQSAHKFGIKLMTKVIRKCFQVFPRCNTTCPLSQPLGSVY